MHSNSAKLWARAQELIPWGTQTNAKRLITALADEMPAFIERAQGCRITDVDGREYIDYRCSLGPVFLGHRCAAVETAVCAQLEKGVLFSMASPIEVEVAGLIHEMVPGAEMVRFVKTGGEAVMACIRLARACTGRDLIVTTGYHGWHDAVASAQSQGVPEAIRRLTLHCPYGDVDALTRLFAEHPGQIAAVVALPYDWGADSSGRFPRTARELTAADGALLIFDEVLTGFRLARGGGAEYFGVIPDLAAYAKALANGFPLAAFTGRAGYMNALDRTIVTTTYAGETLSLAAALATLRLLNDEAVYQEVWQVGRRLMAGLSEILHEHGLPASVTGLPPYFNLAFRSGDATQDGMLFNTFYTALFRQGVFSTGPWLLSYAHKDIDVDATLLAANLAAAEAAR